MATNGRPQDSPVDLVNDHIRQYVESGGDEGHIWREGSTILLLTTIGRRSGTARRTALIYRQVGEDHVVVASKGGAETHPAWYLNLAAEPSVTVQVKDVEFAARARVTEGAERDKLWRLMNEVWPHYAEYQTKTDREIPVVVLEKA